MPDYICTSCQYVGKPAKKKRGSTGMEIFMWTLFPLGLPYTLWRMLSKKPVCMHCGEDTLLSSETIIGHRLISSLEKEISEENLKKMPSVIDVQKEKINTIPKIQEQKDENESSDW